MCNEIFFLVWGMTLCANPVFYGLPILGRSILSHMEWPSKLACAVAQNYKSPSSLGLSIILIL